MAIHTMKRIVNDHLPHLTTRETQVTQLVWNGFRNSEIGKHLNIAVKTVEAHRANVMKKWRCRNTAELIRTALKANVVKV